MDILISTIEREVVAKRMYTHVHFNAQNGTKSADVDACLSNMHMFAIDRSWVVALFGDGNQYEWLAVYGVNDVERGYTHVNYLVPANLDFMRSVILETAWCYAHPKTCRRILRSVATSDVYEIDDLSIRDICDFIREEIR